MVEGGAGRHGRAVPRVVAVTRWHPGRMEGVDGALPARQTWFPAKHRRNVRTFATGSGLMVAAAVFALVASDGLSSLMFGGLFAVQAVNFGIQASYHARTRLEADQSGLHVVAGRSTQTYPWDEITEIRPSIARGRRHTHLVAVRERGLTVDLPVTEEHLEELLRWHRAAR